MSRASAQIWRLLRYQIEEDRLKLYGEEPTVLIDVTDFMHYVGELNATLRQMKAMGPAHFNIEHVVIAAADMKNMYPATTEEKIIENLDAARKIHRFCADEGINDKIYTFMLDSIAFATKHSLFTIGERRLAWQIYGLIIGSFDGGEVSDSTYYVDEVINKFILLWWLLWKRYRDDVFMSAYDAEHKIDAEYVKQQLTDVYGTHMEYTVELHRVDLPPIPYLDCTCELDRHKCQLRTTVYQKPGNTREMTRRESNVPRHVLKGMVCGMMKRYAIISDTKKKYMKEVRAMEAVLRRQGWSARAIGAIHGKPKYEDRERYIAEFMVEQRRRKRTFMQRHCTHPGFEPDIEQKDDDGNDVSVCRFWMMSSKDIDKSQIVAVGDAYNACYDDGKLKQRIEKCRAKAPMTLQNMDFILAQRGDVRVSASFKSNGL